MRRSLALVLAALAALPLPALAAPCGVDDGLGLTAADADRLSRLAESRARGIKAALGGPAEAKAAVATLLPDTLTPVDAIPPGPYRCRTIKLGGEFGRSPPTASSDAR